MTFTKEQLQEIIDTDHVQCGDASALARMALAGMNAEPVVISDDMAYAFHHTFSDSSLGADEVEEIKTGLRAAFANVPAPQPITTSERAELENYRSAQQVVCSITQHFDGIALETAREIMCDVNRRHEFLGGEVQLLSRIQCRVDDACRAAMLPANHSVDANEKDKAEPVSNRDELPVTQFKPVADLYGITSPTGSETSFTFDAVEARDFIDGGWSCQEYVELERYQATMTNQSEQVLDMVNSPVIPDGWVMVPVEPTAEMIWAAKYVMTSTVGWDSFKEAYKSMIAAAPQQESVSSALEHGMARYSGAMQKLADGGD